MLPQEYLKRGILKQRDTNCRSRKERNSENLVKFTRPRPGRAVREIANVRPNSTFWESVWYDKHWAELTIHHLKTIYVETTVFFKVTKFKLSDSFLVLQDIFRKTFLCLISKTNKFQFFHDKNILYRFIVTRNFMKLQYLLELKSEIFLCSVRKRS